MYRKRYKEDVRQSLKGHDAQKLIDHYKWHQEKILSFFYDFNTTEDGKLKWCFCIDVIGRLNYSYFGDILMFDATYNMNQCDLIFATFVRLNHYSQSIFMGRAFHFKWIFWFIWIGVSNILKDNGKITCNTDHRSRSWNRKASSRVFQHTRQTLHVAHIRQKF